MLEMETCETCRRYKPYPGDHSRGTCERGCFQTYRDRWCVWYKNNTTGRADAAPAKEDKDNDEKVSVFVRRGGPR